MGLYLGLPQDNYPGRRPQAPACFNPAMHKASDAGHIEPHGMRRCPEAQKRLMFEERSMCIKHRKYRQKWPLGGVSFGQGAELPKS